MLYSSNKQTYFFIHATLNTPLSDVDPNSGDFSLPMAEVMWAQPCKKIREYIDGSAYNNKIKLILLLQTEPNQESSTLTSLKWQQCTQTCFNLYQKGIVLIFCPGLCFVSMNYYHKQKFWQHLFYSFVVTETKGARYNPTKELTMQRKAFVQAKQIVIVLLHNHKTKTTILYKKSTIM